MCRSHHLVDRSPCLQTRNLVRNKPVYVSLRFRFFRCLFLLLLGVLLVCALACAPWLYTPRPPDWPSIAPPRPAPRLPVKVAGSSSLAGWGLGLAGGLAGQPAPGPAPGRSRKQ